MWANFVRVFSSFWEYYDRIVSITLQCPVAVKKLKSDDQVPLGIIEEFKNEVKQMASLNNDYIVKLIGVCVDSGS